jgi:hypothetical protein
MKKTIFAVTAVAFAFIGINAQAQTAIGAAVSSAQQGTQVTVENAMQLPSQPSNTNSSVTYHGVTTSLAAPTVYAPALTSGMTTCTGSTSTALTTPVGGGTHANTTIQWGCERRDDASAAHALGRDDIAVNIMCESKVFNRASQTTDKPCDPRIAIQDDVTGKFADEEQGVYEVAKTK